MAKKLKESKEVAVEAEFKEVVAPAEEEAAVPVKCAVTVGMTEAGDIFFNIDGSDQNLLLIQGLLNYANRHMDNVWEGRLAQAQQ